MIGASAYDTFIDIEHNPFIDWSNHGTEQRPATWTVDDIACAKVLAKLRREIGKCEFKLAHPPLMYSAEQRRAFAERMHIDIAYWTSRLAEARYN